MKFDDYKSNYTTFKIETHINLDSNAYLVAVSITYQMNKYFFFHIKQSIAKRAWANISFIDDKIVAVTNELFCLGNYNF
jgi:hypothetical protein